jgi:hypothetical protein
MFLFPDESGACSRDLLRTFSRSKRNHQADRFIVDQNAKKFSILPAISYSGLLALSVLENCVNGKHFEHFIKYRVVSACFLYLLTASSLTSGADNFCDLGLASSHEPLSRDQFYTCHGQRAHTSQPKNLPALPRGRCKIGLPSTVLPRA